MIANNIKINFGATCGDANYDPTLDVNKDTVINTSDYLCVLNKILNETNSTAWCESIKASTENPCGKTPPCGSYGDINQDNYLTSEDATLISEYIVGNITFSNEQKLRADVNNDGKIDVFDSMFISQYVTGTRDSLPCCGKTPPCGSYGDITADGYVTQEDITDCQKCIAGTLSGAICDLCDVDGSGSINVLDTTKIERYIGGIDSTFPVCGTSLRYIENQLASISDAVLQLAEKFKELLNR